MFWVPQDAVRSGIRRRVLVGWEDLPAREDETGVQPGDPIFLAPDHTVDPGLGMYGQSIKFRRYTTETRRNYATDITLFLNFLSGRDRRWTEAMQRDMEDYEHWRRFAGTNPQRIGGTKWDRELAAFTSLYTWAVKNGQLLRNPVAMKQIVGREGEVLTVPEARAKDARHSNVHWLTPRTWRRWIDIGLRGHTLDGVPEPGWVGRLEDRNVAFVRLLTSSGLRRAEAGSLLTFEVPARQVDGGRYYRGKVAAEATRSKKQRTFYVSADAVGEIEAYVDSSRALAVRHAQKKGRYARLRGLLVVTEVTRGRKPVVRWRDQYGVTGERALDDLTGRDRMLLFTEGPRGVEPLWLCSPRSLCLMRQAANQSGLRRWDG